MSLVVFCPRSQASRRDKERPPFAVELATVPRQGDLVTFYKTEHRHPACNVREGDWRRGERATWKVVRQPLHVADLDVVAVQVEYIDEANMGPPLLEQVAEALDIEPAPKHIPKEKP